MTRTMMVVLAATFTTAACSTEGAEYRLRLGHDQTEGHPFHLAMERFADSVRVATGGAVEVSIFPASQLGDTPEQIEGLRMGALDLSLASFSHVSQFCPDLGLFGVPYLFEDDEHFAAVFDGEIGERLDRDCAERYTVRLLSTLTSGYRVLFNGTRPVQTAADLRGLKLRVMGGEADAVTWQVFGAIPVPMPYSEVYSALQAGVIDGGENEPVSILSNNFYEPAPYIAPTNHLVLPLGLFANPRSLDRLPEEYRAIVEEQARNAAVWEREYIAEQNALALERMQEEHGVQVSDLDPAELRDQAIGIQDQVAASIGAEDLLADVRAAAN